MRKLAPARCVGTGSRAPPGPGTPMPALPPGASLALAAPGGDGPSPLGAPTGFGSNLGKAQIPKAIHPRPCLLDPLPT